MQIGHVVCQGANIKMMLFLRKSAGLNSEVSAAKLHLRVNVTKNQRNRGHSSKFNFAHTLSIGRPKSHTYDKDVRLLKFSLVWEKST